MINFFMPRHFFSTSAKTIYEIVYFMKRTLFEWFNEWNGLKYGLLLHLYLLKLFLTTVNVMQAISNGIQSIIYLEANGKNNIHTLSHSIVVRVSSVTYPLVFSNFRTVTSNSSQILVWFFCSVEPTKNILHWIMLFFSFIVFALKRNSVDE